MATSHAILLLAMHPHIQTKAMDEIYQVFGSLEEMYIDYEKLCQLNYMEMIIKEAMRLFPVAPFISRECTADTQISNIFCKIFLIRKMHNL